MDQLVWRECMKICFVSNLHLFSEIGGNWPEDSFRIFTEKILPAIKENNPDAVIFMGNIIAPPSGLPDSDGKIIAERNARFVDSLKNADIKNTFSLKGKNNTPESLMAISEMGGPKFVHNEWIKFGDIACYFFSSRYPNIQSAEHDLELIPLSDADTTILLMHENILMPLPEKNLNWDILDRISKNFDIIINSCGEYRAFPNVWDLPPSLPGSMGYSKNAIEIDWREGEEPEIIRQENKFGIHFFDSQKKSLEFFPIDIGIKFVFAHLSFQKTPATLVRKRLVRLSELISEMVDPKSTILRINCSGYLISNTARLVNNKWIWDMKEENVGWSNIQSEYFQNFYNGSNRDLFCFYWNN